MKIVVSMPAFNEAEGIQSFLQEIHESLQNFMVVFVVVDDCSNDSTSTLVNELTAENIVVKALRNETNRGHGPSTLRAIQTALTLDPDLIITTDGDGQFLGSDIYRSVNAMINNPCDIVEGVRTSRDDPSYRRIVSWSTRTLVGQRSKVRPMDANTPLRVYQPEILRRIVELVPDNSLIPNLHISAISRVIGLRITEMKVTSIPRRGSEAQGSTWGKSRRELPSKRFVKFCALSVGEWWQLRSLKSRIVRSGN